MLESIRQNLKGTLVVIVIIIFIVPMVISGVGTSFLGSSSAQEAANVDGETISNMTLDRAIRAERNRLLQMGGIDATSPLLEDARLKGVALDRLTRRASLVAAGKRHSMTMSDMTYAQSILEQEAFQTDGSFDEQKFRSLLAQSGLTSSSYKEEVADDLIVRQQILGLEKSAFVSDYEFSQIARLTHQKRSFFSITFPQARVSDRIEITEDDIVEYYESEAERFRVPEKIKLNYLELSLDDLARDVEVDERDVRDQYDAELANFTQENSYTVAHILIEDASEEKLQAIVQALSSDGDFAALAAEYSDDFATKEQGGMLGVLTPGMFPEAFENAVKGLEPGSVSEPVETEAGTHFIKLVSKTGTEAPSFESRAPEIRRTLAQVAAKERYDLAVDQLGDLTFSSTDLSDAAKSLNLDIQSTAFFDRGATINEGILAFAKVREAAFSDDLKVAGHNSNTLELSPGRTVVLRVSEIKDAYIEPLDDIRAFIQTALTKIKTEEALGQLLAEARKKLKAGENPEAYAKQNELQFKQFSLVKRNVSTDDFTTIALAFGAPQPASEITYVDGMSASGDKLLVGVTEVVDGAEEDLEQGEKEAIITQLANLNAELELSSYLDTVYASAEVELH